MLWENRSSSSSSQIHDICLIQQEHMWFGKLIVLQDTIQYALILLSAVFIEHPWALYIVLALGTQQWIDKDFDLLEIALWSGYKQHKK